MPPNATICPVKEKFANIRTTASDAPRERKKPTNMSNTLTPDIFHFSSCVSIRQQPKDKPTQSLQDKLQSRTTALVSVERRQIQLLTQGKANMKRLSIRSKSHCRIAGKSALTESHTQRAQAQMEQIRRMQTSRQIPPAEMPGVGNQGRSMHQ